MITRRTVIKTSAWSVPAVAIASAAPAFATSTQPLACVPMGCKYPGKSWGSKCKHSYVIASFNCNQKVKIDAVTFAKDKKSKVSGGSFKNGSWVFHSNSSDAKLWVRAYSKGKMIWEGEVKFPAQQGGNKPKKK